MNKLPVFRTAGRAIGFTFYNGFTIFRLAWLPFTAYLVAQYALAFVIITSLGVPVTGALNPFTVGVIFGKALFLNIANILLQALVVAAVAVSIHRVILFRDRREGNYFNFAFGKTEALYLLMGFISALIFLSVFAAFFAPLIYLASGGDPVGAFKAVWEDPKSLQKVIAFDMRIFGALYFVVWVILIYVSLRLAVWPPAVVATNRLSLGEAWGLTRGNVWRFVGAFVLTFGWIYLLISLAVAAFFYNVYRARMPELPPTSAPASSTVQANPSEAEESAPQQTSAAAGDNGASAPAPDAAPPPGAHETLPDMMPPTPPTDGPPVIFFNTFSQYTPLFWLLELLAYIYFTALAVALVSFSYKALKGYDAHEPIPAEA